MAALAGLIALSIQGCAPAATADADSVTASHIVSITQARAVFTSLTASIDKAAASADATRGLSYLTGSAWAQASAEYAAQMSESIPVTRYRYSHPTFVVPSLHGYPEWFVVEASRSTLTAGHAGAPVETLLLFSRQKASLHWTLSGQAVLSTKLPAFAMDHGYAIPVSTTDPELLLRPDVVGATQAAVVDEGPSAPAAAVVAKGPQTDGLYRAQSALAHAASAQNLVYSWLLQGTTYPQVGLQLRDGGAVVFYGMALNTTVAHPNLDAGKPIKVPAGFFPLFAAPTEGGYHEVYADWTYQYAAIDPPAKARGGQLQVIATQGSPSYGHAY